MITFENRDCMDAMKGFPDGFFDLSIVDPPYGGGFAENGGCKGWFTKYHTDNNNSQFVHVERERESPSGRSITDSAGGLTDTKVSRTGGTWATKYAKKS